MGNTEHLIGAEKWRDLRSVGMVESQRTVNGITSTERRYYLLDLNLLSREKKLRLESRLNDLRLAGTTTILEALNIVIA